MPELPEVENTRQYLRRAGLPGRVLAAPAIGWRNALRRPSSVGEFAEGIAGRRVVDVRRRGKYLIAPLDDGQHLVLHLGMTGSLRIHEPTQEPPPMTRHTFPLDDGRQLRFMDPRKFGHLWLLDDPADAAGQMGPEPLSDDFTPEALASALSHRKAPIKALLLEQSVIAGLGNLYADESLFQAGIHPERAGAGIAADPPAIARLHDAIVAVLRRAVSAYAAARDAHWPDPPVALSPWDIPRRKDAPCPRCNAAVLLLKVRNRSTWHCPKCQPPAIPAPSTRHSGASRNLPCRERRPTGATT